jgi:hypothetical protein
MFINVKGEILKMKVDTKYNRWKESVILAAKQKGIYITAMYVQSGRVKIAQN